MKVEDQQRTIQDVFLHCCGKKDGVSGIENGGSTASVFVLKHQFHTNQQIKINVNDSECFHRTVVLPFFTTHRSSSCGLMLDCASG